MDRTKYYRQRKFEFYYNFLNADLSKPNNISDYTYAYCIYNIGKLFVSGLRIYEIEAKYKISKPIQKLLREKVEGVK